MASELSSKEWQSDAVGLFQILKRPSYWLTSLLTMLSERTAVP
jgi:hypothetical protein